MNAIEVQDLFKAFNNGRDKVFSGVNLSIPIRKISFLLGPSGTGKSVLLKTIVGLMWPDRGEIRILGKPLPYGNEIELNEVRKHLGVLFQGSALFDNMNVFQNVSFPLVAYQKMFTVDEIRALVSKTLLSVGFEPEGILNKYPNQLSGGMQKRVALARAVILKPEIILYDEPTTGLDPVNRLTVEEMILDAKEKMGLTNFVITHDIESALALADYIAFLHNAKIVFWGSPEEFRKSDYPLIQSFLNAERHMHRRLKRES